MHEGTRLKKIRSVLHTSGDDIGLSDVNAALYAGIDVLDLLYLESCVELPISVITHVMMRWGIPVNKPTPPRGMPAHLALDFGGQLAAPSRLPLDLWWPDQEPEQIVVMNLPWGSQDRTRAVKVGGGRLGVKDTDRTRAQKEAVAKVVRGVGVQLGEGPVDVHLGVFADTRQYDVDNVGKLHIDAAKRGGLYSDDNMRVIQNVGLRYEGKATAAPFIRAVAIRWAGVARHAVPHLPDPEELIAWCQRSR